ncbi:MAG: hypothetical protein Kow0026_19370 [Oricola sp.]
MSDTDKTGYDRKTLLAAAAIFAGFALLLYFLPDIMLVAGSRSRWLAGAVMAAVLVLPFLVLWLRGRARKGR